MHKASSSNEIISRMVLRIMARPRSLSSPEMFDEIKKSGGRGPPLFQKVTEDHFPSAVG